MIWALMFCKLFYEYIALQKKWSKTHKSWMQGMNESQAVHVRSCFWLEHSGIQEPRGRSGGVAPESSILGKSQLGRLSQPQFLPVSPVKKKKKKKAPILFKVPMLNLHKTLGPSYN